MGTIKTKAAQWLWDKGLKNTPLDSGISGGGDAPRIYASDCMQTYSYQETAPLKDRIAQLESELQMLQDYLIKEGK